MAAAMASTFNMVAVAAPASVGSVANFGGVKLNTAAPSARGALRSSRLVVVRAQDKDIGDSIKDQANKIFGGAESKADEAASKAKSGSGDLQGKAESLKADLQAQAEEASEKVKGGIEDLKGKVEDAADSVKKN